MTLTATSAQPHSLSSQRGSPRFIKHVHVMPLLVEIHPFILPKTTVGTKGRRASVTGPVLEGNGKGVP